MKGVLFEETILRFRPVYPYSTRRRNGTENRTQNEENKREMKERKRKRRKEIKKQRWKEE
jgi:hypothetical protein